MCSLTIRCVLSLYNVLSYSRTTEWGYLCMHAYMHKATCSWQMCMKALETLRCDVLNGICLRIWHLERHMSTYMTFKTHMTTCCRQMCMNAPKAFSAFVAHLIFSAASRCKYTYTHTHTQTHTHTHTSHRNTHTQWIHVCWGLTTHTQAYTRIDAYVCRPHCM